MGGPQFAFYFSSSGHTDPPLSSASVPHLNITSNVVKKIIIIKIKITRYWCLGTANIFVKRAAFQTPNPFFFNFLETQSPLSRSSTVFNASREESRTTQGYRGIKIGYIYIYIYIHGEQLVNSDFELGGV